LSAFSLANFRRNAGLVLPLFRLGNDDVLHAVLTASTGGLEDNAEGFVKSLLHQPCLQEPALSRYAEQFIGDPLGEQNRPKAKLSIENMCQCLQDILTESSIGRIFLVINNLHLLEDSPLTDKLLAFIKADVSKAKAKGSKAKWVLTSQKDEALQKNSVSTAIRGFVRSILTQRSMGPSWGSSCESMPGNGPTISEGKRGTHWLLPTSS